MLERGSGKRLEQRMTVARGRGKFRVKLAANEPRMIRQLDHFAQAVGGRHATDLQARLLQLRQQGAIDFVTMPMPLGNFFMTIHIAHQ